MPHTVQVQFIFRLEFFSAYVKDCPSGTARNIKFPKSLASNENETPIAVMVKAAAAANFSQLAQME